MKWTLSVFFILLTGCQTMIYGKASDLQRLSIGMNKAQVFEALGEPFTTSADAEKQEEKLIYLKTPRLIGWADRYEIILKDSKVIRWGAI